MWNAIQQVVRSLHGDMRPHHGVQVNSTMCVIVQGIKVTIYVRGSLDKCTGHSTRYGVTVLV